VLSRRMSNVPVERTVRMVQCEVCGRSFETTATHAKYCPACREGATLVQKKEYWKRYYAENKGRMDACHTAYVELNKDSVKRHRRKYYRKNQKKIAARQKNY
jgi:hypothetical protein